MPEATAPAEEKNKTTPAASQDPKAPEGSAPAAQITPEAQADKERLSSAIAENEKKNEALRKAVHLQAELVTENPDLIHKIAASDKIMANQIIEKVWGSQGIKSYEQLVEKAKLEDIKKDNPALYETKSELAQVKSDLQKRTEREQKTLREAFFAQNGIVENEYDPKYKAFQEALNTINPALLEEDYGKALALAAKVMADATQATAKGAPPAFAPGGGTPPAPLPAERPAVSEQSSWLAQQLNKQRGYKIQL